MRMRGEKGFTIIEAILAMGLFALVVGSGVAVAGRAFLTNRLGEEETYANFLATEGIEAVRAIAARDYLSLISGSYGLSSNNGFWEFWGASNSFGKFTRTVVVSDVFRDSNQNIITSGGSLDPFTKRVEVLVTWNFSPGRSNSVSLKTYFTDFQGSSGSGGDLGCRGVSGDWRNPVTLGSIDLGPGNQPTGLDVKQKIVYLSAQASAAAKPDFFIVDATDGQRPFVRASLNTGSGTNAVDTAGNYAYLANNATSSQLQVIDVTNLSRPELVSALSLPGVSGSGAVGLSVFFYNSKIYVGTRKATGPEFHVIDVSNPLNPVPLGSREINADVNAITVSQTTAYLATSDSQELKILDVSDPAAISSVGGFDAPGNSELGKSLNLVGTTLYLGRTVGGNHLNHHEFHILDVSNPASVVNLGSKDIAADVNGIVVCENLAFLATSDPNKEFQAWNVADPANITLWSLFNFPQAGSGIDFEGNFVYVAVRSNDALRIITSR